MDKETLRMQMLSGLITESEYKAKLEESKDLLNENFVGMGMVGNIFDREKTDYELAFEHFTQGASLNEEVEEAMVNPNTSDRVSYLENVLDMVWKRGKGNNPIDFKDLSQSIVNDMFDDLEEGKDEMPEAPSHEETDAAQVYEDELSEDISKVSIYQEGKKWIVAHPVATRLETKEFDAIEDAYEYYAKVKSSSNK